MVFANIEYLFLLLLLIPYIVWYIMRRKNSEATLQISDARVYAHAPKSYKNYLLHAPFALRIIALTLIILVLARPQTTDSWQNSEIEGIDIMLAIDVSTSMLAEDLKPNRLEAAKDVAAEFINGRPNDNVGITLFAGESFTQCPLTVDHAVLLNLIKDVKCGLIEDGTAVGMGIANAVTRLKDSKAKGNSYNVASVSPEIRMYVRDDRSFQSSYWGLYGLYGEYDVKFGSTGRQGNIRGLGISYGYIFKFNRFDCLYFDLGISAGYNRLRYDKYFWYDPCNAFKEHKGKNYWGPSKIKASLVWRF